MHAKIMRERTKLGHRRLHLDCEARDNMGEGRAGATLMGVDREYLNLRRNKGASGRCCRGGKDDGGKEGRGGDESEGLQREHDD